MANRLIKRSHWKYALGFLLLTCVFYWDGLPFNRMIYSECLVAEVANFKMAQDGLQSWDFPLWMNHYHGGIPFFANAQNAVLHYNVLLGIISPTFQGGCNLGILVNTFLAGLLMFYLMVYLGLRERDAFISGLIYMFCGFALTHAITIQSRYSVFAWAPMIFLVVHRALASREWVKSSLIAGIVMAIIAHSSGLDFFLYASSVIVPIVFAMYILGKGWKWKVIRCIPVVFIVGVVFFGLMAIRLLPLMEWGEVSGRGQGFGYEQSIGGHLQFEKAEEFYTFVINMPGRWVEHTSYASLGPLTLLLVLLSIPYWRKKTALPLLLIAAAGLLIGAGTYLYYPIWKFVPGISSAHHVDRFLFLFQLGMSALAGFGSMKLFEHADRKKLNLNYLLLGLVLLLFLSSAFLSARPIYGRKIVDLQYSLDNNHLLNYIGNQTGVFRIHNFNTNTIAGFAGMYSVFKDEEILYGTSPIWITDYLNEYLSISHINPPKFYGMLNTRYIYSDKELDIRGFELVKEFDECENCIEDYGTDRGIDGPYLYENLGYLPRAYFPNNSVLVVGDYGTAKATMYDMMKLNEFFPGRVNIVIGPSKNIGDYSEDFLKGFHGVVLVDGVEVGNSGALRKFVDSGGQLLPNIIGGKSRVTFEEIASMYTGFGQGYEVDEADTVKYGNDIRVFNVSGRHGWLQLAEKFYMFDGWNAYADGKGKEIYRSNGVNSAIWIGGEEELVLEYKPQSFYTGMWITLGTIFALIFLYIFNVAIYSRKPKSI